MVGLLRSSEVAESVPQADIFVKLKRIVDSEIIFVYCCCVARDDAVTGRVSWRSGLSAVPPRPGRPLPRIARRQRETVLWRRFLPTLPALHAAAAAPGRAAFLP